MMIQPEWRKILEASIKASRKNDHWLARYHHGIMRAESFDINGAQSEWEKSLKHQESAWTLRNLAFFADREGKTEQAYEMLKKAWQIGPKIAPLAIEYGRILLKLERYAELKEFINNLPEEIRNNERIAIIEAKASLETGNLDGIDGLFDREYATIREGEVTLTDLWFALHERKLADAEKLPIDDVLRKHVRQNFPPPENIDFRIISEIV
jgi:tetratricopeptide (TPR) repeat protein